MPRLRFVRGSDLYKFPALQDSMFKDRASQFVGRLQWSALTVDHQGWERDDYDFLNPLYVVWELDDGSHGASMRLLPMDGPNMVHDHFDHIVARHIHRSADIWECSRFVATQKAGSSAVPALFLGAGELFKRNHSEAFIGLFDQRMLRVYKKMKYFPEIIGAVEHEDEWMAAGIWRMSMPVLERSLKQLHITRETVSEWYEQSQQISSLAFLSGEKLVA